MFCLYYFQHFPSQFLPHKQIMRAKNGVASLSNEFRIHPWTVSPTDNVLLPDLFSSIL